MDLSFESSALQRLCNRRAAIVERLGDERAAALAQCLQELHAADTLATAACLPHLAVTSDQDDLVVVVDPAGTQIVLHLDGAEAGSGTVGTWGSATAATVIRIINGNLRLGA